MSSSSTSQINRRKLKTEQFFSQPKKNKIRRQNEEKYWNRRERPKPKRKRKTHIAEVASPVLCTFISETKLDLDLQVFRTDDLFCTSFVYLLGFAVDKKTERGGAISWDEGDGNTGWVEWCGERD